MKLEVGDAVRLEGSKREMVVGSVTDEMVRCICLDDDTEKEFKRADADARLIKIKIRD